jgi:hypothetical protein
VWVDGAKLLEVASHAHKLSGIHPFRCRSI